MTGCVADEHALPEQNPGVRRAIGPVKHRRQQSADYFQRQTLACLAVAGGGEIDAAELPEMRDRRVAMQNLENEQSQRRLCLPQCDQRREQPIPPEQSGVTTELIHRVGDGKIIRKDFAPNPRQCQKRSHPWPPVQLVN
jgi:hypothetical protein